MFCYCYCYWRRGYGEPLSPGLRRRPPRAGTATRQVSWWPGGGPHILGILIWNRAFSLNNQLLWSQIQALAEGGGCFVRMFSLLSMLLAQVVLRRRLPPCSGSKPGSCWLTTLGWENWKQKKRLWMWVWMSSFAYSMREFIYCPRHFISCQSNFLGHCWFSLHANVSHLTFEFIC